MSAKFRNIRKTSNKDSVKYCFRNYLANSKKFFTYIYMVTSSDVKRMSLRIIYRILTFLEAPFYLWKWRLLKFYEIHFIIHTDINNIFDVTNWRAVLYHSVATRIEGKMYLSIWLAGSIWRRPTKYVYILVCFSVFV